MSAPTPDELVAQAQAADPAGDFVACSVIEFGDGGEPSVMLLHRGTRDDCDRVAQLLAAVSYSGDRRPIVASYLVVTGADNYVEAPA